MTITTQKIMKNFAGKSMKINIIKILAGLIIAFNVSAIHAKHKITYLHTDALGSTIAATDENGDLEWKQNYRPYGSRYDIGDTSETPKTYTGHVEDTESGLVYMQARYYNPTMGRFMAMDSVRFQEDNIHSFNRYKYANNNPYKFVDMDGKYEIYAHRIGQNKTVFTFAFQPVGRLGYVAREAGRKLSKPAKVVKGIYNLLSSGAAGIEDIDGWYNKFDAAKYDSDAEDVFEKYNVEDGGEYTYEPHFNESGTNPATADNFTEAEALKVLKRINKSLPDDVRGKYKKPSELIQLAKERANKTLKIE